MNPVARLLELTDGHRLRWARPAVPVLLTCAFALLLQLDMKGAAGLAVFMIPLALALGVGGRLAALAGGGTREDLLGAGITPATLVDGGCVFVARRSALWGLCLTTPLWWVCFARFPELLAFPAVAVIVVGASTLLGVGLYHPAVAFHLALHRMPAAARPLMCLVLLGGYAWAAWAALSLPWWLRDLAVQVDAQNVSPGGSTVSALAVQLAIGVTMLGVMRAIAIQAASSRLEGGAAPARRLPRGAFFAAVLLGAAALSRGEPTATAVWVLLLQALRVYSDTVPTLARERQLGTLEALALTGMTARELVDGRAWRALAPRLAESLVLVPLALLGGSGWTAWVALLVPAAAYTGLWDSSSGRAGLPFRGIVAAVGLLVAAGAIGLRTPPLGSALFYGFPVWLGLLTRGLALWNLRQEGDRPGFVR